MQRLNAPELETEPSVSAETASAIPSRGRTSAFPSLPEAHRTIPIAVGATWFRKVAGFRRARLSRRRRLHGPRQLGHRHRRRLEIRLHAAQRHRPQQFHGDDFCRRFPQSSASPRAAISRRPAANTTPAAPSFTLWVLCEIAIAACDLAEVLGSAVALKLLFGSAASRRRADHRARRADRPRHCRDAASA